MTNLMDIQKKWDEMIGMDRQPSTRADFIALIRNENVEDDHYTDLTFLREVTAVIRKNEVDTLIGESAEMIALDMYEAIIDKIIEASGETYEAN